MKIPTIEYLNKVKFERTKHHRPIFNPLKKERRYNIDELRGWKQVE